MNRKIKEFAKKVLAYLNRFPFINSFRLRGAKLNIKGARLFACKVNCHGNVNVIICHKGATLRNCCIYINGNNNLVEIGERTNIVNGEIYIEDDGNRVVIGNGTNLCGKIHLACIEGTSITIGDKCLFSSDIVFRTGDSHSLLDMDGNRINPAADIFIDDHVWIGHKVLINKGVRVCKDSMIGTGAVVTKAFDKSNIVIAGVPAKIVKTQTKWDIKRL